MTGITLQANESIASYDVSALFTSVPIDPFINIIRRLELDQESRAGHQPTGGFLKDNLFPVPGQVL